LEKREGQRRRNSQKAPRNRGYDPVQELEEKTWGNKRERVKKRKGRAFISVKAQEERGSKEKKKEGARAL